MYRKIPSLASMGILIVLLAAMLACAGEETATEPDQEQGGQRATNIPAATETATTPVPQTRARPAGQTRAAPAATVSAASQIQEQEPTPSPDAPTAQPEATAEAEPALAVASAEDTCSFHFRDALHNLETTGPIEMTTLQQISQAVLDDHPSCTQAGWSPVFSDEEECRGPNIGGINVHDSLKRYSFGQYRGVHESMKTESGAIIVHFTTMPFSQYTGCWAYSPGSQRWQWWEAVTNGHRQMEFWDVQTEGRTYRFKGAPPLVTTPARNQVSNPDADSDREALTAFFRLTDGEIWDPSGKWATPTDPAGWPGVSTNDQGRVTHLQLEVDRWFAPLDLGREAMAHLGDLSELESIILTGFWSTEGIAPELAHLSRLHTLQLTGPFRGELPRDILSISTLRNLTLTAPNNTSGPYSKGLTVEFLADLANMPNLEQLTLRAHQITGPLPGGVFTSPALQKLDLTWNQLEGNLPPEAARSTLTFLSLAANKLTGEIAPEIDDAFVAAAFGLDWESPIALELNQFSGCVSEALAEMTSVLPICDVQDPDDVKTLWAMSETWGGQGWGTRAPIYEWFGITTNRAGKVVRIDGDQRSLGNGNPFPPEIGDLSELRVIDLEKGGVTGEIPSTLGKLVKLTLLNLDGNRLTGDLPSSLANLTALEVLDLDGNRLSINLPNFLFEMENLTSVSLSDNIITGCIPTHLKTRFWGAPAC